MDPHRTSPELDVHTSPELGVHTTLDGSSQILSDLDQSECLLLADESTVPGPQQ